MSRSNSHCNFGVLLTLLVLCSAQTHAAPATAESKVEIQRKSTVSPLPTLIQQKNIVNPLPTKALKPGIINKKLVPLKKLPPLKRQPVGVPGTEEPESSTLPEAEPATVYEEPVEGNESYYYPEDQQNYGGGGYYSPREYTPESNDGYYQQPEYNEPSPKPFRGVDGSLLDQQQFEFKPLAELSPSATPAEADELLPYELGQVLVATLTMADAKQLQQAVASAGYRPKSRTNMSQLGFVLTIFRLPAGVSPTDAVAQMKQAFPGFLISANTRYRPLAFNGDKKNYAKPMIKWSKNSARCAKKLKIGLLDSEVDTTHHQLSSSSIISSSVLPAGVSNKQSDHGTAIASLLVGKDVGLLPEAELFAVNVFRSNKDNQQTTTAWIISAINDLLEKEVSVINLSLGGERDALLEYAVKKVFEKQVLMVAAAGNSGPKGSPVYPAAYPEVIAVTAVDARRKIYPKANRGGYIDIAAPGVDVWSTASGKGRYYTGTSFAAPFVTAALAVLRANKPSAKADEIKASLMGQLEDLGKQGKDEVFGQGLLNAASLCN